MTEPIRYVCACGRQFIIAPASSLDEAPGTVEAIRVKATPDSIEEVRADALPTTAEQDVFRERIRKFTEIILPTAGMGVSKLIGGAPQKVRVYIQSRFGVANINKLTVTQWEELLTHFDITLTTDLVAEIEASVTAYEATCS